MNDPGLPPRPRSLNLLESLVKEEEAKEQSRGFTNVVIPTETRESVSPEFYDVDKQQLTKETSASKSFTEFKMKDTDSTSKVPRGDPHAGFKGKKMRKQRTRSNSADKFKSKKSTRPFSADYNQNKRNKLSANDVRKGRPKTTTGRRMNNRTSSPKGQRPRSPHSYSSDTYSSDDEYIKKERFRSDSRSPEGKQDKSDLDSFFDSDRDSNKKKKSYDSDKDSDKGMNRMGKDSKRSSSSSSDSSSSDEDYREENKKVNGHFPHRIEKKVKKTVYADNNGKQRTKSDSESSDYQRMVVVDDYSSTVSSSEDESKKHENVKNVSKPPHPAKKAKPLLSRKKRQGYKIFQVNPDLYIEGKLHQKYTELEELMSCSFVDQKSHVTRHHLYQMELLRDQYQNASHGQRSAHAIIPHSLPEDIRNRSSRPTSAKRPPRRIDSDQDSVNYETAYGTLRSVMTAERARHSNKIRTDIHADRPNSAKHTGKKKKRIEASYKARKSDTEEETSERPSFSSKADSRTSSSPRTPRAGPSVDDHIKYSKNEKLQRWLKEKDKIYRQHIKEEKRKKREEREKLVNEANEKFENRLKSQKVVKKWMKEKSKEWIKIQKEKRMKEREEDEWLESYKKTKSVPGESLRIRPQSAPVKRPEDEDIDNENLKEKIHSRREEEEEKKQTKLAQEGPHPPQTKFIYKRPVAGKIKLKLQVRGKSPTAQKTDSESKGSKAESESERAKQMRLSYDDWVKKKRSDDITRKENAKKQRELAKSDPELERIIPALGKKRIEDKLNMRKRIDTGIKKFDDKTNKSYGGGEFNGEAIEEKEKPRNAYRLESDRRDSGEPAMTAKQLQRPSTAPSGRGTVPSPQKSANSPRKAVIPQRVDKVMANENTSNPYILPFPPDKGIPPHVAERQRRLFADQITDNLDEIEQRALLNAELIKEGVSEADISAVAQLDNKAFEQYQAEKKTEEDKHSKISELMYSPRKQEDSSESSSDENVKVETNDKIESDQNKPTEESEKETTQKEISKQELEEQNENIENKKEEQITTNNETSDNGHSHYKTYDNLNELTLDSENKCDDKPEDHLKEDIEILKQRVENLHIHSDSSSTGSIKGDTELKGLEGGVSEMSESVKITVVSEKDNDPNIVGILKESKRENIPVLESSEEPELRQNKGNEDNVDGEEPGSPQEDSANFRKRVSFNEQTEVFQSFESTSTDTVTPEQDDFDVQAESLDAQQGFDNDDDDDDRPDIMKLQGQKMTINIGGFELNPTVIKQDKDDGTNGGTNNDEENKTTFITNPEDETGGSD
ncbi:trichohyalin-like [Mercenaria mercenaria]|uniref:trichohyalin-like n=1 Tax=Mercenaria mercenaria TaxID=6596 RepID=UPI00234E5200|nr:trichohyalin-like [Mercenaria mercenaria]